MPFHRCCFHLVWATYQRQPLLVTVVENKVIEVIRRKSQELRSEIYAINCVPDHIHVAVSIALNVSVSDWVKQVKGLSAHEVNQVFPNLETHFRWQSSYGIPTFGAKYLPFVISYVEGQKEHHQANTIDAYLERDNDPT
jgi:REP element-mobilizing transposase RayT